MRRQYGHGPTVCQPQMVHMLAFKLGLPMFLRAGPVPGRAVHIVRRGISFQRVLWFPTASCLWGWRSAFASAHLYSRTGQDHGAAAPSKPCGLGAENSICRTFRPASRPGWMCAAA